MGKRFQGHMIVYKCYFEWTMSTRLQNINSDSPRNVWIFKNYMGVFGKQCGAVPGTDQSDSQFFFIKAPTSNQKREWLGLFFFLFKLPGLNFTFYIVPRACGEGLVLGPLSRASYAPHRSILGCWSSFIVIAWNNGDARVLPGWSVGKFPGKNDC